MNYYEELLIKIDKHINSNEIESARNLIIEELKQAYVPRDIEYKLKELLKDIGQNEVKSKVITDEELVQLLKGSKENQLIAVNELNKRNLREYIDICNDYLTNKGFLNAKVLLIDSLIGQEIGEEIKMNNNGMEYEFIPKYLLPIEESDGYIEGIKYLEEVYLKEPSKLKMAKDLLYKELILKLPINLDENEGILIAKDINEYIEKAFSN